MASKFVVLFSLLAAVNAGDLSGYVHYAPHVEKTIQYAAPVATVAKTVEYAAPAYAKTVQYAAPVYAKTIQYAAEPAYAKTIEYAAPAYAKTVQYAAPAYAKTVQYAAPVATKTIYPAAATPVYATAKAVYDHEPIQYDNYHAKTIAYPSLGHYGHGTVSHHGKIIATPHSILNKYDTRIISEEPHYTKYATAAIPTVYKSPIAYPTVVKTPVVPVVKSHYEPEYHHSYAHAAPVLKAAAVSYSPASVVSHATFESANTHYAW